MIHGDVDELTFRHAWKNGIWHCYEAVSFDLADADNIKNKARRWSGHMSAVRDAADTFKPFFIVGAPLEPSLKSAFNDAVAILKSSPVPVTVFQEDDAAKLADLIESDIRQHS